MGLHRVQERLDELQRQADTVMPKSLPLAELMPDTFVAGHSKFASIAELIAASGCDPAVPGVTRSPELNAFIAANTAFPSWAEMRAAAVRALITRSLTR